MQALVDLNDYLIVRFVMSIVLYILALYVSLLVLYMNGIKFDFGVIGTFYEAKNNFVHTLQRPYLVSMAL